MSFISTSRIRINFLLKTSRSLVRNVMSKSFKTHFTNQSISKAMKVLSIMRLKR